MRVALQVVAILERAGLSLIRVDRHEARPRFLAHEMPFATCGKARTAETAQPRVLHRFDHVVDRSQAVETAA